LRDRLAALYGTAARIELVSTRGQGFTASLSIPLVAADSVAT
jgi:hypothetical protein